MNNKILLPKIPQTPQPPQTLTIESLYTDLLPYLPHSELKLFLYHYLQSQKPAFNNTLDLMKFCKETNISIQTAYRALYSLKKRNLIPQNTIFVNTYEPENKQP